MSDDDSRGNVGLVPSGRLGLSTSRLVTRGLQLIRARSAAEVSAAETSGLERHSKAREHLREARIHLDEALMCWEGWEDAVVERCVTECLQAYREGLAAATTTIGKNLSHHDRDTVDLAKSVREDGTLKTDIAAYVTDLESLVTPNRLFREWLYNREGLQWDSYREELVTNVEVFLDEVEALIRAESKG